MVSFSRNSSYSAFKFVNAKGMLFLFQVLAETVRIPQLFDDFLIWKGILNILFGNICFKKNIVSLFNWFNKDILGDKCKLRKKKESFPPVLNGFLKTSPENKNIQ